MKIRFRAIPALCALVLALALPLPSAAMTVAEEKELGDRFLEAVRGQMAFVEDPVVSAYIQRLGKRVVERIPDKPMEPRFFVADQDVLNAFAGPGGFIVIFRGAFTALESEGELAGIMAHETAHVTCRHISKKIAREQKIQLATLAGVIAGIFLGAPAPAMVGGMAGGSSVSLAYSREDERQADEIGREYMSLAGYGGAGYLKALERMRTAAVLGPQEVPTYLTTHPGVDERMAAMDRWLSVNPKKAKDTRPADEPGFLTARARLLGLYGDQRESQVKLNEMLLKNPDDPFALYGLALYYSRLSRRSQALKTMKKAVDLKPFDADFLAGMGQAYLEAGMSEEAKRVLYDAVKAAPENALARYWLGRAVLDSGDEEGAKRELAESLRLCPEYSPAMYFLAQALGRKGDTPRAHYYFGLYSISIRDWETARFHLGRALNLAGRDPELTEMVEKAFSKIPLKTPPIPRR